jgi:hypothetical protein
MTEFEYAERLVELLASLQKDVMQPLRVRLKEIAGNAEESATASERELKRQTAEIKDRLKEVNRQAELNKKGLVDKGRQSGDSRNALILHYRKSLADLRLNCSRIQRLLQDKGISTPAEQINKTTAPSVAHSVVADRISEASRAIDEVQQVLAGPLADFNSATFKFRRILPIPWLIGAGVSGAIVVFDPRSNTWMALAILLAIVLVFSGVAWFALQADSWFKGFPEALRHAGAAYATLQNIVVSLEMDLPKRLEQMEFEKTSKLEEIERLLMESTESYEQEELRIRSDQAAVEQQHQARLEKIRKGTLDARTQLTREFMPRVGEKHRALKIFWEQTHQASAEWSEPIWRNWQPDPSPEFAARMGKLVLEDGVLAKELPELNLKFELPALVPFASGRFLLFESKGNARPYVEAIQSVMLRALANVPPGKLRFTFVDPVGLGQSVAPFMALGDLDEQLISGRAWSESQHIEQQLGKLTEHMEMVIQKYLRHDYASIRDYNLMANEVAEPFRFLVIFDFPTNFNDSAIRRLVSIIRNGPRCGIFTLLLRNTAKSLPYGFNFEAELRPLAFNPCQELTGNPLS